MLTLLYYTAYEGITSVARTARAGGIVIYDTAEGIVATGTWAGIFTAFVDARLILTALGTGHTFGSAIGRGTHVIGHTGAYGMTVQCSTYAVQAAR